MTDLGQAAARTPAFGWEELLGGLKSPAEEATVEALRRNRGDAAGTWLGTQLVLR